MFLYTMLQKGNSSMTERIILFAIVISIVLSACGNHNMSDDEFHYNEIAESEQDEKNMETEEKTNQAVLADTASGTAEISYEETTDVSEEKNMESNGSTAESVSSSEENLLNQITDLDRNVKEMIPAIDSYIDTMGINEDREFTVSNTDLYWGFVLSYCISNGHYNSDLTSYDVNRYELEEASRAAFYDFQEIPDTVYSYSGYDPEFSERYAVEDNIVRMPGANPGEYYILRGWEPSKDGQRIDVKMDDYTVAEDEWLRTYTVHLQPVKKAIEYNAKLKFFITGVDKYISKYGCEYSIPYNLNNYDEGEVSFHSFEDEKNVFGNSYIEIKSHIENEYIEDWDEYCSYVLGDVSSVSFGEEMTIDGRQTLYVEGTTRMAIDLDMASFKRYLINIDGKGIVDIGLYSKEKDTHYEDALDMIVETIDTSNANAFFISENESVDQETNNRDAGDAESGDYEFSETNPLSGTYTDIIGDAVFYLAGEAGNTKGGCIYRSWEEPSEIFYSAEGFDDSLPTYVYIDGILNGTYQIGTGSGYLQLNEENRKEGLHTVDVIQYANDDSVSEIVICKKCRYQMFSTY